MGLFQAQRKITKPQRDDMKCSSEMKKGRNREKLDMTHEVQAGPRLHVAS